MRTSTIARLMKTTLVAVVLATTAASFKTAPAQAGPANGTLDPAFGVGGSSITPIGGKDSLAYAMAVQPDGKYVLAGRSGNEVALARYASDGGADLGFGSGGTVVTTVGVASATIAAVALQPDGKIVVAGYSNNATDYDAFVLRYTTTGVLDPTFGSGGKLLALSGPTDEYATAVGVQADGKIVITGSYRLGMNYDTFLERYTSAGALDSTFGVGGKVTGAIGAASNAASAIALQPDGKILISGYALYVSQDSFVARFATDGTLDPTFGSGGIATAPMGPQDSASAIALQSDGKIVLAIQTSGAGPGGLDFAVARFTSVGVLDSSFGTIGKVVTPIGATHDYANAVALQPDGKIVVAGYMQTPTSGQTVVVRYLSDGNLDPSFGTGGKSLPVFAGKGEGAYGMAVQPDGKIVIAGAAPSGALSAFLITRYDAPAPISNAPRLVTTEAPIRILDTRNGAKPLAGSITHVNPGAPAGTLAALVNITATGAQGAGFVSADKCSTLSPLAQSNLNYSAGTDIANTAVVSLDADGTFCIYTDQPTHLVVDLQGTYQPVGLRLLTQNPTRVLDTRSSPKPGANTITHVASGAPSGAAAALVNLTVTAAGSPGYITANKCSAMSTTPPPTSNANYQAGGDIANGAVVNLDPDGSFCIYTSQTTHLVVDIQGTYQAGGKDLIKTAPTRVLDTRTTSKPGGNSITHVTTGSASGTTAVLVNLTVTGAEAPGYITADKCSVLSVAPQTNSNANYQARIDVANTSVVNVDADGSFCIYTDKSTHLIVDLQGTY
jgi:uncharacterized delta-60 repeat protein